MEMTIIELCCFWQYNNYSMIWVREFSRVFPSNVGKRDGRPCVCGEVYVGVTKL